MATWVMLASVSQSATLSRSRVIVPNVLSSIIPSASRPVGSGIMRQAVILFLWTSKPAHRVNTPSILHPHAPKGLAGNPTPERAPLRAPLPPGGSGKLATVRGAGRYPGPVLSQARGTNPNTTSHPVLWGAFYRVPRARHRAGLFSWVVVPRGA